MSLLKDIQNSEGENLEFKVLLPDGKPERGNIGFDEEICYDYKRNLLAEQQFYKDFKRYSGRQISEADLINMRLLKENDGELLPTNDYVLFMDINQYFYNAVVKCARFKGNNTSHLIDRKEIELPIHEQIGTAMKFAEWCIARGMEIQGALRVDIFVIPMEALREAIANAVVHRSYSSDTSPVTVNIFDDRVEITSPGTLPGALDVAQIKAGRSEIRNKVAARLLKEMRLIEQWGTSIGRIIESSKDLGVQEPIFEEIGQSFRVTIFAIENWLTSGTDIG